MFSDKLLIGYIVLSVALYLRETTLTDTLRQAFYQFIDIFLPYYVVSRSLKKIEHFRTAILCFVIAAMILAAIGLFEAIRHWLLYKSLINSGMTAYLLREGFIRATASAGHPIVLGYVLAIAMGLYLYLRPLITSKISRQLGLILLCVGLLAPLSRGPWVGAACIILVFIATGKNPARGFSILLLFGVMAIPISLILPGGEVFMELLPFVGSTDKSTVDFRGQLFEASMIVINRYPWFGSIDYLEAPEMEALRQNGLIDVVNTYVGIALERGFIGVGLFIGFCLSIIWGIYRRFRRLPDRGVEEHLLGRVIVASFVGLMVIIGTVSSIGVVSIVQWSIAGIGVAYINMMVEQQKDQVENEKESVLSRQFSR